ncbi:MAG TPA: hypothetical protein VEI24_07280, partial [Nitrospiria bacterium]|nr:hypothetical protein [Nitrospiria bacterium]
RITAIRIMDIDPITAAIARTTGIPRMDTVPTPAVDTPAVAASAGDHQAVEGIGVGNAPHSAGSRILSLPVPAPASSS